MTYAANRLPPVNGRLGAGLDINSDYGLPGIVLRHGGANCPSARCLLSISSSLLRNTLPIASCLDGAETYNGTAKSRKHRRITFASVERQHFYFTNSHSKQSLRGPDWI